MSIRRMRSGRAALAAFVLVLSGCKLDSVDVPSLSGPAELAVSLRLTVTPDVIVADGKSTAVVQAEVRGPNGEALAGVDIFFALADESGRPANLGTLDHDRALTSPGGLAQVTYKAPARTDATANQTLLITARPVGTDANSALYRVVRLELRSAEPRLFPQNPDNDPDAIICNWAVEAPDGFFVGRSILFQSTSSDPDGTIVRYFWDFGDGGLDDKPDVNHVYRARGEYSVTHVVTDDDGGQAACFGNVSIN